MHSIIKIIFAVCCFSLINVEFYAQDKELKMDYLLMNGRYFEVTDFYYNKLEKDSTLNPIFRLQYKFNRACMLNHPDSAAVFLEQLLGDGFIRYCKENTYSLYNQLLCMYIYTLQDYKKALFTCERMRKYLIDNIYGEPREKIQERLLYVRNRKEQIRKREKYPKIRFAKNGFNNAIQIKNDDIYLYLDGKYNNKNRQTMFDTGVSGFFFMSEKNADSLCVRNMDVHDENKSIINGVKMHIGEGLLDSAEIANVKMYNIPVSIFKFDPLSNVPDSLLLNKGRKKAGLMSLSHFTDLVIGYPAMSLMGRVLIDFEHETLTVLDDSTVFENENKQPNMAIVDSHILIRLIINGIPMTVHVDFGSAFFMQVHQSFYDRYMDKIPVKALAKKEPLDIYQIHKIWKNVPYEVCEDPKIQFNNKDIPISGKNQIQIFSQPGEQEPKSFDGHVGCPFFKSLGKKVLLDFVNMRIDVIE